MQWRSEQMRKKYFDDRYQYYMGEYFFIITIQQVQASMTTYKNTFPMKNTNPQPQSPYATIKNVENIDFKKNKAQKPANPVAEPTTRKIYNDAMEHWRKLQGNTQRQANPFNQMRQSMGYIQSPKEAQKKNGLKASMYINRIPSKEKLDPNMPKKQKNDYGYPLPSFSKTTNEWNKIRINTQQTQQDKLVQENERFKQQYQKYRQEYEKMNKKILELKTALDKKLQKEKEDEQKIKKLNDALKQSRQKQQSQVRKSYFCQLQRQKMEEKYRDLYQKHQESIAKNQESQKNLRLSYNPKLIQDKDKIIADLQAKVKSYQMMEQDYHGLRDMAKKGQEYRKENTVLKEKLQAEKASGQTLVSERNKIKTQYQRLQLSLREALNKERAEKTKLQVDSRKNSQANATSRQKLALQWQAFAVKQKSMQDLARRLSDFDILISGQVSKHIRGLVAELGRPE